MIEHLYIHIPFCTSKCHYCGFYSETSYSRQRIHGYPALVAQELALWANECIEVRQMQPRSIYIGGGTPSLLGAEGFTDLADALKRSVDLSRLSEWSVEINPASATLDLLEAMRCAGVNRVTFGMQSFNQEVLLLINRSHTPLQGLESVQRARQAGFQNIGIDLIAALPGLTPELWQRDLHQSMELAPTHISVYNLSLEPATRLAAMVAQGLQTPDEEQQMELLAIAEAALTPQGFIRYEISNYALSGCECQHNLGIWRGNDYLGLGPSAASRIGCCRIENHPKLDTYEQHLNRDCLPPRDIEILTAEDDAVERSLFALRLHEGFSPEECRTRFSVPSAKTVQWEQNLRKLACAGAVEQSGQRWRLTRRGREICDHVIRELC